MLYDLLISEDTTNVKLALQMKHLFSKDEWFNALQEVINTGKCNINYNYNPLWTPSYTIGVFKIRDGNLCVGDGWSPSKICELYSNTLNIKYKGKGQLKKILNKLEKAIK